MSTWLQNKQFFCSTSVELKPKYYTLIIYWFLLKHKWTSNLWPWHNLQHNKIYRKNIYCHHTNLNCKQFHILFAYSTWRFGFLHNQVNWSRIGQCGNIVWAFNDKDNFGLITYFLNGARALVGLDMFGMKCFLCNLRIPFWNNFILYFHNSCWNFL